jgi:hypothetical protein
LSGTVASLTATASDNVGVTRVEFYIDGTLQSTDSTSPYSASLNTSNYTNASHSLTAKAYDAAGNVGTASAVNVTINNPPAVIPTLCTSGTRVEAETMTISGGVAVEDSLASGGKEWGSSALGASVQLSYPSAAGSFTLRSRYSSSAGASRTLYIDGASKGSITFAAAGNYTLLDTPQTLTAATHTIKLSIDAGNESGMALDYIDLCPVAPPPDTTPPSIIITAPFANTTIAGTYTVSVNAADASGVSKVDFSIDSGAVLLSDTTSPYSYDLDTTKLTNAPHSIKVTAYDTAGNSNNQTVAVTVNNTITIPTVKKCDFNTDNKVDSNDLFILLANYNKTVVAGTKGDCNSTTKVDLDDLFILLGLYGK